MIVMSRKYEVFDMVRALHSLCSGSCGLHGGEKKSDEHADDGNDDKKFDEGEGC